MCPGKRFRSLRRRVHPLLLCDFARANTNRHGTNGTVCRTAEKRLSMANRGLGRGLNQLMSGQKVAHKSGAAAHPTHEKVTPVDFGRGLNSLVAPLAAETPETPVARLLLPAWFFFAADLLLLAYTVAISLAAAGPLDFGEVLFAFVSTSLGAILAILGVHRIRE